MGECANSQDREAIMKRVSLRLQPSESVVVRAAVDIYSAQIQAGKVDDSNKDDVIQDSIETALKIALGTEKLIRSDRELA